MKLLKKQKDEDTDGVITRSFDIEHPDYGTVTFTFFVDARGDPSVPELRWWNNGNLIPADLLDDMNQEIHEFIGSHNYFGL